MVGQAAAVDEGEEGQRHDARAEEDGRGDQVGVAGGDQGALLDEEQRRTDDEDRGPGVPAGERRCGSGCGGGHVGSLPAVGRGEGRTASGGSVPPSSCPVPRGTVPTADSFVCTPNGALRTDVL